MRKHITSLVTALLIVPVLLCGICLSYLYFKDTGTEYGGKARLHYNWKYLFAEEPAYEYEYGDENLSFAYRTSVRNNRVRVFKKEFGGTIYGDLLDIYWYSDAPREINSELAGYLVSAKSSKWEPSSSFMRWLNDGNETFSVAASRIVRLKDGSNATILLCIPNNPGATGNYRWFLAQKGGLVVKAKNLASSSAPEAMYRRAHFGQGEEFYFSGTSIRADGARDRRSSLIFSRFTDSFSFKN